MKKERGMRRMLKVSAWIQKRKKPLLLIIKYLPLFILFCILAAIAVFLISSDKQYRIASNFTPLPLVFDADSGTSSQHWLGTEITVKDGFIKGLLDTKGGQTLVVRALGPFPSLTLESKKPADINIKMENINPDMYASSLNASNVSFVRSAPSVLEFTVHVEQNSPQILAPAPDFASMTTKIAVLGDSRDGYDTFTDMVNRVNGEPVLFSIDNGDLVFSGKPNQYRLFDNIVSQSNKTVCLIPGNHDIRNNGRQTYEMLYGPAYYSFDAGSNHYAFVDSSTGWATKTAIPDEQYAWLERDLAKAEGKQLFVITHIPPNDPREELTRRESAPYFDAMKQDDNLLEKKIEAINDQKQLAHGFPTKVEADRFEKLMEKYGVKTVFLSHIHSYFDFTKQGVRYIITGGAGAELLTKDSYYHFLTYDTAPSGDLTIVERPSPPNLYLQRYASTVSLFATAMYKENTLFVILLLLSTFLFIALLITNFAIANHEGLSRTWVWLKNGFHYLKESFKSIVLHKDSTTK